MQVSELESHTRILLEEQKSQLISQAKFELLLQEAEAENSVEELQRQLRSQDTELHKKRRHDEASRQEQALIRAQLQSSERVFRESRIATMHEMDALKEICCSQADRVQESYADSLSLFRHEENDSVNELRRSQSTVNQLTVQELQEHINSLSDARDFKDLETASSSEPLYALSHQ